MTTRTVSWTLLFMLTLPMISGCARPEPEKSQLEIREMQTRTFQTSNKEQVMQAVTQALLDDGYIIKQTNNKLGLINAQKKKSETSYFDNKQDVYALTAQVRPRNDQTHVRLNIQRTTKSVSRQNIFEDGEWETTTQAEQYSRRVEKPDVYRRLFNKIDKSLFIEEEVNKKKESARPSSSNADDTSNNQEPSETEKTQKNKQNEEGN